MAPRVVAGWGKAKYVEAVLRGLAEAEIVALC